MEDHYSLKKAIASGKCKSLDRPVLFLASFSLGNHLCSYSILLLIMEAHLEVSLLNLVLNGLKNDEDPFRDLSLVQLTILHGWLVTAECDK